MASEICLTCSSTIPTRQITSTFQTPCCDTPICHNCIERNPRLKEYIPCLRCGDLKSLEGNRQVREGRRKVDQERRDRENVFEIGDDEDETERSSTHSSERNGSEHSGLVEPTAKEQARSERRSSSSDDEQDDLELVEVRHPVAKGDTLLSISRKYAADPHELITLNSLPPSVLSTQPHLLRTRRNILISRRYVPKGSIPTSEPLFDSGMTLDPAEKEKRERERAIKRFQLLTKTVDPGIGSAYMGLSELDEDLLGEESGEGMNGKKVELKGEGNREQRALEAFYEDESWERRAGGPKRGQIGAWKKVGEGSNMGIKV